MKKLWKSSSTIGGKGCDGSMKVVVIIPTYNERDTIIELLTTLENSISQNERHHVALLVVDDNSPDHTAALVRVHAKQHRNVYLLTGKKEGLGKALLRGMHYATEKLHADIIAQIDADLSHNPSVFPKFLDALDRGADFAIGSRYIPGGSIPDNWAPYRKIYSVVGNSFVRFGLGCPAIHDWTGGYRAFHRKYFDLSKDKLTRYRGYVFQIALLHRSVLAGANVSEVPIHFTDRKFGHSKIAPAEYIRNVVEYVVTARINSIIYGTFGKFAVVGLVGFIINTFGLEFFVSLGVHPASASALGAEMAIVSNFLFNNSWTFRHRKITGLRRLGKFFQFNVTSLGALLIQAGMVAFGTLFWGRDTYRIFYIIGVGFGLLWNYAMYKNVIWKKQ